MNQLQVSTVSRPAIHISGENLPDMYDNAAATPEGLLASLGEKLFILAEKSKSHWLGMAVAIHAAKQITSKIGRGSEFPRWLDTYAPQIHRKQADRMAAIVASFSLDNQDRLSSFQEKVKHFHLSALYQLSSPTVSEGAREKALAIAGERKPVTTAVVKEVIALHPLAALPHHKESPPARYDDLIVIEDIRITISAADASIVSVLKAGITPLTENIRVSKGNATISE